MIEPKTPVTLRIRYAPYPAVILASDENLTLKPKSVILRHRHLRQQQTVVQTKSVGSSRPTRGVVIGTISPPVDISAASGSSNLESADEGNVGGASFPSASQVVLTDNRPVQGASLPQSPLVIPQPLLAPAYADKPSAVVSSRPNAHAGPEGLKQPAIVPSASKGKVVLTRGSHAIRSTPYKTIWWMTKACDYLAKPATDSAVEVGDLYVHLASDGRQAWLRSSSHEWLPVEERHAHPFLRDYLLRFLENGEPRWVTKESFRTYTGREKKARREAMSSSIDSL